MTTSQDLMAEAFSDYFAGFKPHEKPNYYDSLYGFEAGYQSATSRQEAKIKALTETLEYFDSLIEHQYTGSREAMSALQHASNLVVTALATAKETA